MKNLALKLPPPKAKLDPQNNHEPREQGVFCSGFQDHDPKISFVSHEPHELLLWQI
jgi:hypothetical protein